MKARERFGLLLIVVGVLAGLYFGLWWAFIGGIVGLVEAIKATDIMALDVAMSVARIVFAGLIGWGAAAVCVIPGIVIMD